MRARPAQLLMEQVGAKAALEANRGLGCPEPLARPEAFWPRLSDVVLERKPDLLVVDSINPLIEGADGRAYLLNAVYR
ncbi:MAG: hypothetical protein JZD41_01210, partial [Thermoproteus sp.]|nr:hypothetical protein [Thermoproteus sp.]